MLQIPVCLIVLWISSSGCDAAKTAISPDVLSTIAKTVASALSPTLAGELQSNRTNRSSVSTASVIYDKRSDELATSSTSNDRISKPVSSPLNAAPSLFAEGPYDPYLGRNDGARLFNDYFGPGDGNFVPGRRAEARDYNPSIGLKRVDSQLRPDQGILNADPGLATPFRKFAENNYDRAGTRLLASPIGETSRPFFGPFGFGGPYLHHGGYHGYPHQTYNQPKPTEQPEQPPASENQEIEEGAEPADENTPSQPDYNHGYHHGYKPFGFPAYGPYPYPIIPGHPNFYYPKHHQYPHQNPKDAADGNNEEANADLVPNNQQPGYQPFHLPYGNFHLQGYPAPFYGIHPHDRFHNVHNKNATGNHYGASYGAPFAPFPPFHNFYLPTSKKTNNQNPSTTAAPENPDAERIEDKVSSSESRFDEIVRKFGANQYAANDLPLSSYAPRDDHLIDRFLFTGNNDGYDHLSNLKFE